MLFKYWLPTSERTDWHHFKYQSFTVEKVHAVYIENDKTRMKLAYEDNAVYEY
jgi:hypothetical protein